MNKPAIILILLALAGVSTLHAMEATGTFAEAKATAAANDKPLLVDFYAEW